MRRREISAREAYELLALLLPDCATGHVIDVAQLWPELGMWLPHVMAVGARFGDVFLLPATKGVDDGRFIVARIGCDGRVSCE